MVLAAAIVIGIEGQLLPTRGPLGQRLSEIPIVSREKKVQARLLATAWHLGFWAIIAAPIFHQKRTEKIHFPRMMDFQMTSLSLTNFAILPILIKNNLDKHWRF